MDGSKPYNRFSQRQAKARRNGTINIFFCQKASNNTDDLITFGTEIAWVATPCGSRDNGVCWSIVLGFAPKPLASPVFLEQMRPGTFQPQVLGGEGWKVGRGCAVGLD